MLFETRAIKRLSRDQIRRVSRTNAVPVVAQNNQERVAGSRAISKLQSHGDELSLISVDNP